MIQIETRAVVVCDRFRVGSPPTCSAAPIHFDHAPTDDELGEALTAADYVSDEDGRHWCARHADRGEVMTIGPEFRQVARGVLVRVPTGWASAEIEVKRVSTDG